MNPFHIRAATAADLAAINDIYNYYVGTSTCTYQTEPATACGHQDIHRLVPSWCSIC